MKLKMCLQLKEGVDEKDNSKREGVCDKVACTSVDRLEGIREKDGMERWKGKRRKEERKEKGISRGCVGRDGRMEGALRTWRK
jgi:hypothetical protein